MTRAELETLARDFVASAAFRAKRDIDTVARRIPAAPCVGHRWTASEHRAALGDDTAAIPDGGGHLLFAAEGILPEFLEADPEFAGWCAVMVNVSDIAAMGGWPIAAVDVYFHSPDAPLSRVFEGMLAACEAYAVPLVGGHTSSKSGGPHALAVAILGRAERVLTSFGARAGDSLMMAVDLRGQYRSGFPFWNATDGRGHAELRADLAIFSELAAAGGVTACKDVSNAGVAGTLLMLIEASGVGATLELDALPRPRGVPLAQWLATFPSFGFLLAVQPGAEGSVEKLFSERGIACARVGAFDASSELGFAWGAERCRVWDVRARPFTGFARERAP